MINRSIIIIVISKKLVSLKNDFFDIFFIYFFSFNEMRYYFIDTFIKMSHDAVNRYMRECKKILNFNKITNVLNDAEMYINTLRNTKYSSQYLYSLYKNGSIKLQKNCSISYFIINKRNLENEYKTLLIKDYFITEIMNQCKNNEMLLYYIKSNNIWYYAITTLYFEDVPVNDIIVCDFNSLPVLNAYYNNLLIK